MKTKTENEITHFLAEICQMFPELTAKMAVHEDFMTTSKMEVFAQATTNAIAEGQLTTASKYLSFIDTKLNTVSAQAYEYIDVYYVEHLFWRANKATCQHGWPLLSKQLQQLYMDFHGKAACD